MRLKYYLLGEHDMPAKQLIKGKGVTIVSESYSFHFGLQGRCCTENLKRRMEVRVVAQEVVHTAQKP